MTRSISAVACLLGLAALTLACGTSPLGRSQLLMVSPQEMDATGVAAFQQISEQTPHAADTAQVRYVTCVAKTITDSISGDAARYDWEVVVFDDPTPNAFAVPGGKIGVHTGILEVAENQDQLAAVLGHEVAHVLAQHGNERVSQQKLAGIGMSMAEAVVSPGNPHRVVLLSALGLGVQYGALMPYSRQHETEADLYGLQLSAPAGFDPRASIPLWKNMAAASEGQRPLEILSTHPDPLTRIDDLERVIPEVLPDYEAAVAAGRRPRCR